MEIGGLGKLFESATLTLIVFGLVVFVLGVNGGLSKLGLNFDSPFKQVAVSVLGLMVLAGGAGLLVWREKRENKKKDASDQSSKPSTDQTTNLMKIDGEYHTRDTHHYRIFIIPLPKDSDSFRKHNPDVDYYRLEHADWEGVGFFDNECFYTAFQINDKATQPGRRGNWGVHIARWRGKEKSFQVYGIELKEKNYYERELKKNSYYAQLEAGQLTEKDYYDRLKELELKENDDYDLLQGEWIWEKKL